MSQEILSICNGKYKCHCDGPPIVYVEGIPKTVKNLNVTLTVLMFPGGDISETPIPTGIVFQPGIDNLLLMDGAYTFDFDCTELDGAEAPTDGTAMCIEVCMIDPHGGLEEQTYHAILGLCAKLQANGSTSSAELTAILEKLCTPEGASLVDKICELVANVGGTEGETLYDKVCELLATQVTDGGESLIAKTCAFVDCLLLMKANDVAHYAFVEDCLKVIKANTAAITGIETSLGQVGCTYDAEGTPTGAVLVCKHSDTTTGTDTVRVWWFGYDGTVVEDFKGAYEPCTNLQAILDCLEEIKSRITWQCMEGYDCLTCKPVFWVKGIDKDGNVVYPNGAACPTFYDGELVTVDTEMCNCLGICVARNITGINIDLNTTAITVGSSGDTHTLSFDPNSSGGAFLNSLNTTAGFICRLTSGGKSFVFAPSTLTGGDGEYESTIPVAANNCEQDVIDDMWGSQVEGVGVESNGYGMTCCSSNPSNCQIVPANCATPLDPQPTRVKIGPPPDKKLLQAITELHATQEELLLKQCAANQMQSDAAIKDCIVADCLTNCAEHNPIVGGVGTLFDEDGNAVITIDGNCPDKYPVGSQAAIYDTAGNIIGYGYVESAEYNEDTNQTDIRLENVTMQEGAVSTDVATVKPILTTAEAAVVATVASINILEGAQAVKNIKTLGTIGGTLDPITPVTPVTPVNPVIPVTPVAGGIKGEIGDFTPLFPRTENLVSDNFQDGGGNAPFNLQVRENAGEAVSGWQAVTPVVPYVEIPELNLPEGVTKEVYGSEMEGFIHVFTGKELASRGQVDIRGGLPVPAGSNNKEGLRLFAE